MPTVLVVPCFNEAARLDREAFAAALTDDPALRLVLVDDGSTDDTPGCLRALAASHGDRVDVVTLARNQGKAEAVRRGVLHALAGAPRFVGYWDADLATPLDELGAFRAVFEVRPEVRLVMGSRVKLLGRDIERRAARHYLGRVFATCASWTLGLAVYDTQCGAKLFRVTEGTRSLFEAPFLSRWLFDVELLARLRRTIGGDPATYVVEHPLGRWHDVRGSKVRAGDFAAAVFALLRIAWRYR